MLNDDEKRYLEYILDRMKKDITVIEEKLKEGKMIRTYILESSLNLLKADLEYIDQLSRGGYKND